MQYIVMIPGSCGGFFALQVDVICRLFDGVRPLDENMLGGVLAQLFVHLPGNVGLGVFQLIVSRGFRHQMFDVIRLNLDQLILMGELLARLSAVVDRLFEGEALMAILGALGSRRTRLLVIVRNTQGTGCGVMLSEWVQVV